MMFGLFGEASVSQLEEVNIHHSINVMAIVKILTDKGICTAEDFNRARLEVTGPAEQMYQQMKDDATAQYREDNPDQAKAADFLKKVLGDKNL